MKLSNTCLFLFVFVLFLVNRSTSSNLAVKTNNLKSQSSSNSVAENQSRAMGFNLNRDNSLILVAGFITELMGSNVHKQYKKAQTNFNSMPCLTTAVNFYLANANKAKILNFKESTLSAEEKFCEDLVKNISDDADTESFNTPEMVANQKKCTDVL